MSLTSKPSYYRVQTQMSDGTWMNLSNEMHSYAEAQEALRRQWLYNTAAAHRIVKAYVSDVSRSQRILEILDYKGATNG